MAGAFINEKERKRGWKEYGKERKDNFYRGTLRRHSALSAETTFFAEIIEELFH